MINGYFMKNIAGLDEGVLRRRLVIILQLKVYMRVYRDALAEREANGADGAPDPDSVIRGVKGGE